MSSVSNIRMPAQLGVPGTTQMRRVLDTPEPHFSPALSLRPCQAQPFHRLDPQPWRQPRPFSLSLVSRSSANCPHLQKVPRIPPLSTAHHPALLPLIPNSAAREMILKYQFHQEPPLFPTSPVAPCPTQWPMTPMPPAPLSIWLLPCCLPTCSLGCSPPASALFLQHSHLPLGLCTGCASAWNALVSDLAG